jgi:hypothetical protein
VDVPLPDGNRPIVVKGLAAVFIIGERRCTTARIERSNAMKLVPGRVVQGKVEVEGEPLPEGSTVTVLAHDDDDEAFELNPRDEAELLRRREEVRKGGYVDGDALLRILRKRM